MGRAAQGHTASGGLQGLPQPTLPPAGMPRVTLPLLPDLSLWAAIQSLWEARPGQRTHPPSQLSSDQAWLPELALGASCSMQDGSWHGQARVWTSFGPGVSQPGASLFPTSQALPACSITHPIPPPLGLESKAAVGLRTSGGAGVYPNQGQDPSGGLQAMS